MDKINLFFDMEEKKKCNKCDEWKNKSEFGKNKSKKDGLQCWCKECNKEQDKKCYENNKEKKKEQNKEYYENNKEKRKEQNKKYRENNKEKRKEQNKKYDNSPMLFNSTAKYRKEIELYEEVKESINSNLICKCAYCGEWFEPTYLQIQNRISAINGTGNIGGEGRLYCSDKCKRNCPIYKQILYTKDQKPATSREVQPELRQLVFARDNYTCQKCSTHKNEVGIHCHHIEGILWEPLQSADIDMCITLCEDCHKEVHQKENCGYYDMRCVG